MGLTRQNLIDIDAALAQIEHLPGDKRFVLAVARLRARVMPLVHDIRERGRLSDDLSKRYMDYDAERLRLSRAWALKDDKGEPITDVTGTFVLRSATEFEVALHAVQQSDAHRAAYEEVACVRAEWEAWVKEPATGLAGDLPTLPFDLLPSQVTPAQLRPLLPVLDGADETTADPAE